MINLKMPNIGEFVRHAGKLIAVENIQPLPPEPHKEYIFEEIEARCELRLNGEVIKHIETLNDFYGLESSVETAIKEMKEYASTRQLSKASELEVVVIKVSSQFRAKMANRENFYAKGYPDFEELEYGKHKNLPAPTETIVWSSKQ